MYYANLKKVLIMERINPIPLQGLHVGSLCEISLKMSISSSKNQGTVVQEAKLLAKNCLRTKRASFRMQPI